MASSSPVQVPVDASAHDAAKVFVGITVLLYVAALATITTRIHIKLFRAGTRFGWDDGFIIVGFLAATAEWVLLMAAIAWAADSSKPTTTPAIAELTVKLGVIAVPVWAVAVGCIKISVACLMLRFSQSGVWRLALQVLIGLIAFVMVSSSIFSCVQCIPLKGVWDPTVVGAKCVDPHSVQIVSNTVGGFSIATDLALSIYPLTFLTSLRRPVAEKVLILVLMAVGLTAGAASITKFVIIQQWVGNRSGMYVGFTISTLSTVELLIGSTAACLPCLKAPFQRVLSALGVNFSWESSSVGARVPNIGQMVSLRDESPESGLNNFLKKDSGKGGFSKPSILNLNNGAESS